MIPTDVRPASPARAFGILCRWRVAQLGKELPQIVVAQVLFATGTAVGLGFLIPNLDSRAGAYLATGAFLINLLIVAIAMVPGMMTEAKVTGALDYLWALPFPRLVYLLAELAIWGLAMLPGMTLSLVITSIRFDFDLRISLLVVPAVILVLVTATAVGAAIGLRSPSQQTTNLFTNFVLISVLLFSPVNFPAERLPGWLQAVHQVLPIASMADLVRATLVGGIETDVGSALLVLAAWCTFGMVVTWRSVSRVR
ncbi:MAG TPA: ABC transporter permease [Acidimicrobiales bacterium]|nr:ABC transporter permease [Acidimicrobiales bacterium]